MNMDDFLKKIQAYVGYHSVMLGLIGLTASVALAYSSVATEPMIAKVLAEDKKASLAQVMPDKLHDNDLLQDVIDVNDNTMSANPVKVYIARQGKHFTGAVFETASYGYSGTIRIIMAVDEMGKILGVRVLSHTETPGLGDKIEVQRDQWITKFNGTSLDNPDEKGWHVKKDGGVFDQFSGATITPRAVVKAIKKGLDFFKTHHQTFATSTPAVPAAK
jgi:Na+-translocating ferredoxin:NAD+ oxidoreductase subunit G